MHILNCSKHKILLESVRLCKKSLHMILDCVQSSVIIIAWKHINKLKILLSFRRNISWNSMWPKKIVHYRPSAERWWVCGKNEAEKKILDRYGRLCLFSLIHFALQFGFHIEWVTHRAENYWICIADTWKSTHNLSLGVWELISKAPGLWFFFFGSLCNFSRNVVLRIDWLGVLIVWYARFPASKSL